ncbi:MAG: PEP-CTERM sorting domain-containing protein, partial [Planctomycetales bacterium]|nr:PEP-CTERM sorting domain-containing protein [Planctomycetales bacterium]
ADNTGTITFTFADTSGAGASNATFNALSLTGATFAVPEPSTLLLAGLGLIGLCFGRRRRRHANSFGSLTVALAVVLLTSSASFATAATALIDFGRNTNLSGATYNNVSNGAGAVALNATTGGATGWSITVTEDGSGSGGDAGSGADATTFPAALSSFATTALQDSIFANAGAGSSPSMTVSISGLDDELTYDLLFYGSRLNGQNVVNQTWSITQGVGGANVLHDSLDNQTVVVDWSATSTNGSGVIEFTITGANSGALALNFGSITSSIAVPEPSSLLLAGLGVFGLCLRRRRMANLSSAASSRIASLARNPIMNTAKTFSVALIAFSVLTLSAATSSAALLHQYNFNSAITLLDDNVGTRDLTDTPDGGGGASPSFVASVTASNGTRFGAVRLAGGGNGAFNYLQNTDGAFTLPNFTVSYFARTDTSNQGGFKGLFSSGNGGKMQFDSNSGTYWFAYLDETPDFTSPVPVDQWDHFAITYDGADTRIYYNGAEVVGSPVAGNPDNTFDLIRIGANRAIDNAFAGDIDDFRIYNNALSSAAIFAISKDGFLAVPEPSTALLLGIGLVGLVARRRRGANASAVVLPAMLLLFAGQVQAAPIAHFTASGVGATSPTDAQAWGGSNITNQSAAFETYFDYTAAVAGETNPIVLWEAGGNGVGSGLVLDGPNLHYFAGASNADVVSGLHGLTVETNDVQVVVAYEIGGGTGSNELLSIYVNGLFVASADVETGNDWAGTDNAGVGFEGGTQRYQGTGLFTDSNVVNFTDGDDDDISLTVYDLTLPQNTIDGIVIYVTPEPSTALLIGLGLVGLVARRRIRSTRVLGVLLLIACLAGPTQAATLLDWDGTTDHDADGTWTESLQSFNPGGLDWTLVNGTAPVSVGIPQLGFTHAYNFSSVGDRADTDDFSAGTDPTNNDASFEFWFRPDDLVGNKLIFETGGTADGSSLSLSGSTLQWVSKDDGNSGAATADLTGLDSFGWYHAVAVVDLTNDLTSLYVKGGFQDSNTLNGAADWSGTDDSRLGTIAGAVGGSTGALGDLSGYGTFLGDIAVIRVYDTALTASEVFGIYSSAVIPEPSTALLLTVGLVGLVARRRRAVVAMLVMAAVLVVPASLEATTVVNLTTASPALEYNSTTDGTGIVTNAPGVNGDGLTFNITFTPNSADVASSNAVALMEIGGTSNGSGLYLSNGVVYFLGKMDGGAGDTYNPASNDLDFGSGNNMIGAKSSYGPLSAGTTYTVAAIYDPLNPTDPTLTLGVLAATSPQLTTDLFTLSGVGAKTNWSGDDTITSFITAGSRGGATNGAGNLFRDSTQVAFAGIQGQALYWNSQSFLVAIPEPSTALLLGLGLIGLVARRRRGVTIASLALLTLAAAPTASQAAAL